MSLPSPTEATEQEVDVILHVDPNTLVIGTNVRRDAVADRQLVESVRALGVLDAVSAYRDQDGSLVVLRGQRRTLAGREAQAATIPVRVVPAPEEADRIAGQLVENERREQMSRSDVVQAFSELADLGHSRTWIAKRTGTRAAEVKAALTVAGSTSARTALQGMPRPRLRRRPRRRRIVRPSHEGPGRNAPAPPHVHHIRHALQ